MRVLIVDDDTERAGELVAALGSHGHQPIWCRFGADALKTLFAADLVLLNLGITDLDGMRLLADLRQASPVPIVVMSHRTDEQSAVGALRAGADDYLTAPVRAMELLARIDAVARRVGVRASDEMIVQVKDVSINLDARTVHVGEDIVELSAKEFDILAVLARKSGAAVSRQEVMREVWGSGDLSVSRLLDVYMTSLRAKLRRPGIVRTIRGFGHRLG